MTTTLDKIKEISRNDGIVGLESFAEQLFAQANPEFLNGFDAETLAAIAKSGLKFLDNSQSKININIYNPSYEADGWSCDYTVLEVVVTDRPFVVDSLLAVLEQNQHKTHYYLHPILHLEFKDAKAKKYLPKKSKSSVSYAYELFFIDKISDSDIPELKQKIHEVLEEVVLATDDYHNLRQELNKKISYIEALAKNNKNKKELNEYIEFLKWLDDDNFVFLGYREYDILYQPEPSLKLKEGSGLGILRKKQSDYFDAVALSKIPKELRERVSGDNLLIVSKTADNARVHRPVKMDYIGIKKYDNDKLIGESRFIGLFTSKAHASYAENIPILRMKLAKILSEYGAEKGSHVYKEIVEIFNSMPKADLFWADYKQIKANLASIIELRKSGESRLIIQSDPLSRGLSVMVIMPRERFNAKVRQAIQEKLYHEFDASQFDYSLAMDGDESSLRMHFFFVTQKTRTDINHAKLEEEIIEISRSWDDHMSQKLLAKYGELKGRELISRYLSRFSDVYKADVSINMAFADIKELEALGEKDYQLSIINNNDRRGKDLSQIRIYHKNKALVLSEIMPILEGLGLLVLEQTSYFLELDGIRGIDVFRVRDKNNQPLDVRNYGNLIKQALLALLEKTSETDKLNALVINAHLSIRQVALLRSYVMYYAQLNPATSRSFVSDSLLNHSHIAAIIFRAFEARFNPDFDKDRQSLAEDIRNEFFAALDEVSSLAEDTVLRGLMNLVRASVRSNYYKKKKLISIKFDSAKISTMPEPRPQFEIAVMGLNVEGTHLRGGRVARGGIRWSDRPDDFRTEILGLMKTQMTKNAVIVPVGSKGGFVLKNAPTDRAELFAFAQENYQDYIRALLDLTDNLQAGQIVHPSELIIYDQDDPYLVVAADKGTASFSDLANQVSAEYNYWLADAFASGGSHGYDHKKEAITARGAWESVSRHFREIGIDVKNDEITVIGIGDMAGDVFGNGMLYSNKIRLLAAFNHMHIFLDPNPNAEKSYKERKRLFDLPRSSWADYNAKLISQGGGVYERSSKSIKLSSEVQEMLNTTKTTMSGLELIKTILLAKADLLWNGGIGTYVKATTESHGEVGDASNDRLRINANELAVSVVGEGGNLGFTQLARVEYAKKAGRINTDAIDNSAGVDMSDHEVNIKIALQPLLASGDLSFKQRNNLLLKMTDEVSELVLKDNYNQTQVLSIAQRRSQRNITSFEALSEYLIAKANLDRAVEYLPSAKEFAARKISKIGLMRPELAILLAYSKMDLYKNLLKYDFFAEDGSQFQSYLIDYFPKAMRKKYKNALLAHPLKSEIIATQLTNEIIDLLGIDFIYSIANDLGASFPDLIKTIVHSFELLDTKSLLTQIKALDNRVSTDLQYNMLEQIKSSIQALVSYSLINNSSLEIKLVKPIMDDLKAKLKELLAAREQKYYQKTVKQYQSLKISAGLANEMTILEYLPSSLPLLELALELKMDLDKIAKAFYEIGDELKLPDLRDDIAKVNRTNKWDKLALTSIEMDLRKIQKEIVQKYILQDRYDNPKAFLNSVKTEFKHYKNSLKQIGRKNLNLSTAIVLKYQLEKIIQAL